MFLGGFTTDDLIQYAIRTIVFLLIIPIHESAHALMAKWLGDDTAEKKGRISLNPIVHLDIAGLILMLFLGLGWAKPVPVNFSNLKKNRRASYALISAAGPLSNLISAFLCALVYEVLICTRAGQETLNTSFDSFAEMMRSEHNILCAVLMLLIYSVYINVALAMFNLIPLPPLDGFNLVRAFLPVNADRWIYEHQRQLSTAFFVLLILAANIPEISRPFDRAVNSVNLLIWQSVEWIEPLMIK